MWPKRRYAYDIYGQLDCYAVPELPRPGTPYIYHYNGRSLYTFIYIFFQNHIINKWTFDKKYLLTVNNIYKKTTTTLEPFRKAKHHSTKTEHLTKTTTKQQNSIVSLNIWKTTTAV